MSLNKLILINLKCFVITEISAGVRTAQYFFCVIFHYYSFKDICNLNSLYVDITSISIAPLNICCSLLTCRV